MTNKILDTVYAIKFLKTLTQKWEDMPAHRAGVINSAGQRIVALDKLTQAQKDSYDKFDVLVWNLKRLLEKLPMGKSTVARYAAALKLIQEQTGGPAFECFVE